MPDSETAPSTFLPLRSRPLTVLTPILGEVQLLGATPYGERKIVPVVGGGVAGSMLSGRILPGGGDWALTRRDDVLMLDVRLTIETHDNALIHCEYEGMRHASGDAMRRLETDEFVHPDEMYFRITPRFETADSRYMWLNRILCVGVGERLQAGPRYCVHEIL